MVNSSTTQLTPVPINTGMDDTPTSITAASDAAPNARSFATRLNQARSQRTGDDTGKREPAPAQATPARESDTAGAPTATQNSPEEAASQSASVKAKTNDTSTSADKPA